jgi:hypothetical protein
VTAHTSILQDLTKAGKPGALSVADLAPPRVLGRPVSARSRLKSCRAGAYRTSNVHGSRPDRILSFFVLLSRLPLTSSGKCYRGTPSPAGVTN